MMMVRDDEQSALAELRAWGGGLLVRYRMLIDGPMDAGLRDSLQETIDERAPLLDELAVMAAARGDRPTAADYEVNQFRAVVDQLVGAFGAYGVSVVRLRDAERAWLALLREAERLDWRPAEAELLQRLYRHAEGAVERLSLGSE